MATINVDSWDSFVNALTTAHDDDVINVTSNIDAQYYMETFTRAIHITASNLTIEGNEYTIKNITNINFGNTDYLDVFIFAGNNIKINNLNFSNVWLTSKNTCFASSNSNTVGNVTFSGCTINIRTKYPIFIGGITVNNCMITFNQCTGNIGNGQNAVTSAHYEYCWIRFNGWREVPSLSFPAFRYLKRCYLEGDLAFHDNENVRYLFGCSSCCVNVSCEIRGFTNLDELIEVSSEALVNVINKTKIPALINEPETDKNKIVTDAQMKDSEYLASIGFDIIP